MAERELNLLIKTSRAAAGRRFALGAAPLSFETKPLMPSIERGGRGAAMAAAPVWHLASVDQRLNPWDACHSLLTEGLGVAGGDVVMAEPDLEQSWLWTSANRQAFGLTGGCESVPPNGDVYAIGNTDLWFADEAHSQLDEARSRVNAPNPATSPRQIVRIAHLDTGYDDNHQSKPRFLNTALARNFVDADRPNDATDRPTALINPMFGHGTGTLSILAGKDVTGSSGTSFGGAGTLEVVPIRVANWVVLFKNSAIAQAFDYVHSLCDSEETRVHVLSMSMGGVASSAWADAVNALYERGVFVVTAAGNNFGNLPTRFIVYPARFDRVVAACGVMADGRPYADLPIRKMAGCYGPARKDVTSIGAFTPNVPWAKFGCPGTVDMDGGGTSAATPQVAAAAALWMQKNKAALEAYGEDWMRVEATRRALFGTSLPPQGAQQGRVGVGVLHANAALDSAPATAASLQGAKTPADSASFSILRVLTGLGLTATAERQRMLELEALQISQQSRDVERLLIEFDGTDGALQPVQAQRVAEALLDHSGISATLKRELAKTTPRRVVASRPLRTEPGVPELPSNRTIAPDMPTPPVRRLWVYARDPLLSSDMDFYNLNEVEVEVPWEKDLLPGPVGEYLEVVDVDPPSGRAYVPIDLNHPSLLAQSGYKPTEGNPQFHQQMVYAVAMKTIGHFENALGRRALWAPRHATIDGERESRFVRRLRVYPHALREANAYYSPEKGALLFGYFRASANSIETLPGGLVFNCLSHDVVAHETTHALLDGLHPRYKEPSGLDMLAFHEAFADIVALFQHFTIPSVLLASIRQARGRVDLSTSLADLAQQFGVAIGAHGALRSYIGKKPQSDEYARTTEPHARGALLVAAVFAAFSRVYERKTKDLVRLATSGTGVLPDGDIPHDLATRLAEEAAMVAGTVLNICIRALDYCPPIDLSFGEYLRALITADRDLIPNDKDGYRVAFIASFRDRGIYPADVANLSVDTLTWQRPDIDPSALAAVRTAKSVDWRRNSDRHDVFIAWNKAAARLYRDVIDDPATPDALFAALGLVRGSPPGKPPRAITIDGVKGKVSRIEIGSVRPAWRVAPDGGILSDIIVEMTQRWTPADAGGRSFRGGCTIICDLDSGDVRYVIRKRVGNPRRTEQEMAFRGALAESDSHAAYFVEANGRGEPFAMMHRGV
ncbi:S8 family serine peptidase [Reyranella sp.]|uniref:S8 family serine peptidase n=1 Tax=Reyranella sp. TaxID=1929291 RepID=UPI003BAB0282